MKRLNNKGYLLVEIILAFALAMAITYFVTSLTVKVKNKNDDLLVRTLTSTDQAIIYNMIMREVYAGNSYNSSSVSCVPIDPNSDNVKYKFSYNGTVVFLNEYVDVCEVSTDKKRITIKVNALPDYNFDVVIP